MPKKTSAKPTSAPRSEDVSPTLTRLFQARNEWDRLYQLSNLLKEAQIDLPDFFDSPAVWSTICREPDPEKLAWRLGQEIRRRADGKVPTCLQPYLDRPDLAEQERSQDESRFRTELSQWLREEEPDTSVPPKRGLAIVWKVTGGVEPLQNHVSIELRANSPKLREGARNFFQVRGLCNELAHRPELFSIEDATLLRWLSDYFALLATEKHKHGSPFLTDNRSLLVWLQQWGQSGRCRYEEGNGAVEYNAVPARIVPKLEADSNGHNGRNAAMRLEFEVTTAAGLREPLADAKLFLAPKGDNGRLELELVQVKGCFYRLIERPPRSILTLALKNGPTRLEAAASRDFLPHLLRRYPNLQSQVKVHLRQIPAKAHFYFNLDEEDVLQIRLIAQARYSNASWEWTTFGWAKLPPKVALHNGHTVEEMPAPETEEAIEESHSHAISSESSNEIWDEIPAEADCTLAQEWLTGWNGEAGELCGRPDEPGWWQTLHGKRIPELVKLWQERSTQWSYYGNKRFQQFVNGKRHSFPKIRIQSSGVDWFTVRTEWEEESMRLTPADWQKLQQSDDPYIKLGNGTWLQREEAEQLGTMINALAELGFTDGNSATEQTISALQLAGTQASTWDALQNFSDKEFQAELNKLRDTLADFKGIPAEDLPVGLKATLRPYQHEGFSFLVYSARLKLGAILADDMGLGKTIQSLAWIEHLREKDGPSPSLVVCPASVVFNWQREAEQFTPGLKVLALTAGANRHGMREEIPQYDLIITNYALLRRDLMSLKKYQFRAVILDEAQNIKNPDSLVAKAAKMLNAQHRLALTGTPLENRLLDLWSIVDFVHPGYLPNRNQFTDQYDRGASPAARSHLSGRLRPIVLRRLKKQVAQDLPDRIEERIDCELTEGQRKFYLAELQRSRQALREVDPDQGRIHVLAALTRLRQICCHPALAGGKKLLGSGKTAALFELLDQLHAEGHKVLVFSQFVEMLKLLQAELIERGRPHYMLTGQTTNRSEVVANFQNDPQPSVFLLSLKAAGTGLNLTSASYVILYDPWWNPAVEAQAIDRTHRIGQDRTVIAYRLVTRDTVEEKIWHLQQSKAQLVQDVLGEQGFAGSLTKADLEFLLADPQEIPAEPA
ncbi:MAG: hypothetical protein B9S32_11735 [Verrucomicrobia bacterium Tous-C9LFEB]|nr:MAG: hypothetical protein B9S32_11735 [Verrucomicrobia bacterium Tous-C9LFEB]